METLIVPNDWIEPLATFTEWMMASSQSAGTIKLRRYQLRRFAQAHQSPFVVSLDDISSYLGRRTWNESTRRSARSALGKFYSWATATGRVAVDPTVLAPKGRVTVGKPRPAADDAVDMGLTSIDRRTRLMVRLGAQLGLRCCEIAVIHSADIMRGLSGYTLRVHGKGGKLRDVPMSDSLGDALRALPYGYAFPGQINGHLSAAYVSKLISRALPKGVTAHMLRHRYGTRAYNLGGKDVRAVQELLGHASVATTQIYTAVEDDALRRASLAAA